MAYGSNEVLPLTKEQREYWDSEIKLADQLREDKLTAWDAEGNIKRYAPDKAQSAKINMGADFSDAERKKAGLLFDAPDVVVLPDPETHPKAAILHQDYLNTLLHERYLNAKGTALKAILANLTVIQPSPTKIGYIPTIANGVLLDPTTKQPVIGADGKPVEVPQVVHEEFFWSKLSEKSQLLPTRLRDTDYDRSSAWLGYKFKMPTSQLRRTYNVPTNVEIPAASGDKAYYFTDEKDQQSEDANDPMCSGTYLEYKAYLVDPKVSHPALIRCLVLVDGLDVPVKHEDAPWQIDPITKQFNPASGFKGFSIHPLALRDLPDSGYVPADSTITAQLTGEINEFLQDVKRQRESNRLANLYDPEKLIPEAATRIQDGKTPAFIPVKPGALDQGKDTIMVPINQMGNGREHYMGLDVYQNARERVHGISANTVGAQDDSTKTATEISAVTRNTEARFEQERQRVLTWYLAGVQKLSALVIRYGDKLAIEVLGQQRGQEWVAARDAGQLNNFRFDVRVDGGRYMDIEAERRQILQIVNFAAPSPYVNQQFVWRKVAEKFAFDPAEFLAEPKPKEAEPPKINFSLNSADLNPTLPQFAFVVDVLRQGGMKFSIETVQLAQMQAQALGMAGRSPITAEQEKTSSPDPLDPLKQIESNAGPSQVPTSGVGPDPMQPQPPPQEEGAEKAPRIDQHQLDATGNLPGGGAGL